MTGSVLMPMASYSPIGLGAWNAIAPLPWASGRNRPPLTRSSPWISQIWYA